jgi:hypothetical protein
VRINPIGIREPWREGVGLNASQFCMYNLRDLIALVVASM